MSQRYIKKDLATDGIKTHVRTGIIKFWRRVRSKLVKAKRCVKWGDYKIQVISTPKDRKGRIRLL